MNQFWILIAVPVALSAGVNEMTAIAPWLARRILPGAARLWSGRDEDRSAVLREEWTALIDDCPGKFLKLVLALWFLAGAVRRAESRRLVRLRTRLGRASLLWRAVVWPASGLAMIGWWFLMARLDVALPEAYSLPFAALALGLGALESRRRRDLSSWATYGPALLAAFVPTVGIVIMADGGDLRGVLLVLAAVVMLMIGARGRQQAPVVVAFLVVAVAWVQWVTMLAGTWFMLVPAGMVLLTLGVAIDDRQRTRRLFGTLGLMR